MLSIAENALASFSGESTDFITVSDANKLGLLGADEANEFLVQLFSQKNKKGYISLNSGKVVLFNILEQKLLTNRNNNQSDTIARLKSGMFNEGLIKNLQNKYQTEIFIQGL